MRNLALSAGFFHNGAYARIEDAIRFHLDPRTQAPLYDPKRAGVDPDLTHRVGPIQPVLSRLDPQMTPVGLSNSEFEDLVHFVKHGLLDERATRTCSTIPKLVPSGLALPVFQGCDDGNH